MIATRCSSCKKNVKFTNDLLGTVISCPHCNKSIKIPAVVKQRKRKKPVITISDIPKRSRWKYVVWLLPVIFITGTAFAIQHMSDQFVDQLLGFVGKEVEEVPSEMTALEIQQQEEEQQRALEQQVREMRRDFVGKKIYAFPTSGSGLRCVQFSPDGAYIASGDESGTISVWNVYERRKEEDMHDRHDLMLQDMVFTPDGKHLITTSCADLPANAVMSIDLTRLIGAALEDKVTEDNTLRKWSTTTFEQVEDFNQYAERVSSLMMGPDGKKVLVGTQGTSKWFDIDSGRELEDLRQEKTPSTYLALSSSTDKILVAKSGTVEVIDTTTEKLLHTFHAGMDENQLGPRNRRKISLITYLPNNQDFVFGTYSGIQTPVYYCNGESGKVIRKLKLPQMSMFNPHTPNSWVSGLCAFPDGKRILVSSYFENHSVGDMIQDFDDFSNDRRSTRDKRPESAMRIWDLESGKVTHTFKTKNGWCTCMAISPDGWFAVTGHTDGSLFLWGLPGAEE